MGANVCSIEQIANHNIKQHNRPDGQQEHQKKTSRRRGRLRTETRTSATHRVRTSGRQSHTSRTGAVPCARCTCTPMNHAARAHARLQQLHTRLERARHAARHWPSTRAQDLICQIERQIRQLNKPVAVSR